MSEKNIFLEFVGDTPYTRLLDFLITGREFDYTLTDLATNASMSWSTLHRIFPGFIKNKLVIKTREVGRATLYKLNGENLLVKELVKLYDMILYEQTKKHLSQKIKLKTS